MDKRLSLYEWHEAAKMKGDVLDGICKLAGDSWAIYSLCHELEQLAVYEYKELQELQRFGIRDRADALRHFCKMEEEHDDNHTA